MSRLGAETPYEADERARAERRAHARTLRRIVSGQLGSARVLRRKALVAVLGGFDPGPYLETARKREAQAMQTAEEMRRGAA